MKITRLVIFCCFLDFVILIQNTSSQPFLLVVGDVSKTTARILHENLNFSKYSSTVFEIVDNRSSTLIQKNNWNYTGSPQILKLSNLKENTNYEVIFEDEKTKIIEGVQFKTFLDFESIQNFTVVSCNRFVEDSDPFMWNVIQSNHKNQKIRSGTFHLGDQVYCDTIPEKFNNKYIKNSTINENNCVTYENLTNLFRDYYRITWLNPFMNSTLRNAPNWMIPDDHEIFNNANPDFWEEILHPPKQKHLSKSLIKFFMRAGLQSFIEYQYQLSNEIPDLEFTKNCCLPTSLQIEESATFNECNQLWSKFDILIENFLDNQGFDIFKKIGRTEIILLDTRYGRTYGNKSNFQKHPWLGDSTFNRFRDHIKNLENSSEDFDHVLIFTGMPVFFASNLMAQLAYNVEGDKYASHPDLESDLKEFMDILFTSSIWDKYILLSGDLHMYFESDICDWYSGKCIPQIITSGVSIGSNAIRHFIIILYYVLTFIIWRPWLFTEHLFLTVSYSNVFFSNNCLFLEIQGSDYNLHYYWRNLESFRDILLQFCFTHFLIIVSSLIICIFTVISLKRYLLWKY